MENKTIARTVGAAFGGGFRVTRYWDEQEVHDVHVLETSDSPVAGTKSYSTVNLSNTPLWFDGKEYEVRVELLGACYDRFSEEFGNVLVAAALNVIKSKWFVAPGVVFPDVLSEYYEGKLTTRHLMFVPPFLWGESGPKTLDLATRTVAWLLAVPITEKERAYIETNGLEALEEALERQDADICDLDRLSAV